MENVQIFISYARDDDEPPPDTPDAKGFVTYLYEQLIYDFDRRSQPRPTLWRDTSRIEGAEPFEPRVEAAINNSSIFLVVLSDNWMSRPYCQWQLDSFAKRWASEPGLRERIVIAAKQHVDDDERPTLLRGLLGYQFYVFEENGECGFEHEFFSLGKVRDSARFEARVEELAGHLWRKAARLGGTTVRFAHGIVAPANPIVDSQAEMSDDASPAREKRAAARKSLRRLSEQAPYIAPAQSAARAPEMAPAHSAAPPPQMAQAKSTAPAEMAPARSAMPSPRKILSAIGSRLRTLIGGRSRPLRPTPLTIRDLTRRSPKGTVPHPETEGSDSTDSSIDVSVFAPPRALEGSEILVQVFAHLLEEAPARILGFARGADADATKKGVATLNMTIALGERLDFILEAPGLSILEPQQSLKWNGRPRSSAFLVHVPPNFSAPRAHLCVRVLHQAVPIGQIRFVLDIVASGAPAGIEPAGETSKRYRRAFLSYASPDRAEVLKRAQALRAARIDFFQDLLSLEPGERWERRLYSEIEQCDLFLLFWSQAARESEWVGREITHALERNRRSKSETPQIQPIVLEGPPPKPPETLAHLHFNDPLCYVIASVDKMPSSRPVS